LKRFISSHKADIGAALILLGIYILLTRLTWDWWGDFHGGMIAMGLFILPGFPLTILAIPTMMLLGPLFNIENPVIGTAMFFLFALGNWMLIIRLLKRKRR